MAKATFLTVKTQLIPPKLKKNILRRDRLLKLLQDNLDKKLILITGGAGYGKTTLLAQFVDELESPYVFYTVSESDTNLNTFLAYLIDGIRETGKRFGIRTQSVMEGAGDNLEMLMGTFVNELLDTVDKELFIILEDYHLIDRIEVINKALDYLLDHMPYNIHFIISSRTQPSLNIIKLKAKDNLIELTTDDLKFTREEIKLLFRDAYGLDMPDGSASLTTRLSVSKVESYSEGWVTGLQLMGAIIEKNPSKPLNMRRYKKESFAYFAEEVLNHQPESIYSFIRESCILESMIPQDCNAILVRNDSQEILALLVRENLFTSCIDEEREIFQYHQLFRDFLLRRLVGNRHVCSLHLRAGDYFKSVKDWSNSIKHYLLAQNTDQALTLIEREGENLIEAQRFDTLEQWLKGLHQKIIQSHPTLLWLQGELLRWRGEWDEAMEVYKLANTLFVKKGRREESVKVMYGIASIFRFRGDYTKAIKLGEKVLELIGENVGNRHAYSLLKTKVLNLIAASYYYLENYWKAISTFSEGLKVCKKISSRLQELLIHNQLACYEKLGEYDRVIETSQQIIKKGESSPNYFLAWTYMDIGYCYAFKGEFGHARDALRKALRLNRAFNDRRGINLTFKNLGFLNLMMGNYKQARSYCEKAMRLNIAMRERALNLYALHYISMSYLFEGELVKAEGYINKVIPQSKAGGIPVDFLITKGRIKLETGDFEEAEKILNLALKGIRKSQSKLDPMLVHVALAKLYYKKGEETRRGGDTGKERMIIKHLKKALELSNRQSYHFALIKAGRMDSSLLLHHLNLKSKIYSICFHSLPFCSKYSPINITIMIKINIPNPHHSRKSIRDTPIAQLPRFIGITTDPAI